MSFTLPATPSVGGPLVFDYLSLPVDLNGKWTDLRVVFDSSVPGGGVLGLNGFYLFGRPLFSWSSSSSEPVMDSGTFQLFGASGTGVGIHVVTLTDHPTAAPESFSNLVLSIGALMLFGVHLIQRFACSSRLLKNLIQPDHLSLLSAPKVFIEPFEILDQGSGSFEDAAVCAACPANRFHAGNKFKTAAKVSINSTGHSLVSRIKSE